MKEFKADHADECTCVYFSMCFTRNMKLSHSACHLISLKFGLRSVVLSEWIHTSLITLAALGHVQFLEAHASSELPAYLVH